MDIKEELQKEFSLKKSQVENVVSLIDQGNTIPFIARYRKEMTGNLDDQVLRNLSDRLEYLRNLESRKEEIVRLIAEQEKLTPELEASIRSCSVLQELEDLYRPYRPKRKTRATIAKARGLEPLAEFLLRQGKEEPSQEATAYLSDEVPSIEDALSGARDIIAELVSDNASFRKEIRRRTFQQGKIVSKAAKEEDSVYEMYYDYTEEIRKEANHRILAMNRGEKEGYLNVTIQVDADPLTGYLTRQMVTRPDSPAAEQVSTACTDAYGRLISPSIEREIRSALTERAEESAIKVFSKNLRGLLLQPPVKGHVCLGVDPGYRTGCKLAVVDETGKVLATDVIYPTPPKKKIAEAKQIVKRLLEDFDVTIIAIGNGTASKESEIFIAETIAETHSPAKYAIVNEAGASVYSASKLAAEEFPDFDVTQRSAVSIARRLQDPLTELVKIDPKSIGVGQYQHDMNQKHLGAALGGVVEDCVNHVGVDLNTASPALLSYVSGINATVAKNIVAYREENGKFTSRRQIGKVPKLGKKAFEQCAGFLRIPGGKNVLDNTAVHPESYHAAEQLLEITGCTLDHVREGQLSVLRDAVSKNGREKLAQQLGIGVPTLEDIINELLKPGRDPRSDLPMPELRTDVMGIEDLKPGMVLTGTVRNVIDFGAFVDIGVHQDGLVHISQICNGYIKHPLEKLSVGDIVKVRVLEVDTVKNRISLSMKEVG